MTTAHPGRTALRPSLGRRLDAALNTVLPRDLRVVAALVVVVLVTGALIWQLPRFVPLNTLVVPLVLASLVLGPRELPWFVVFSLLVLALLVPLQPGVSIRTAISVVVLFSLGFIILLSSFRRSRLGVAGLRGESMLVDLRDRIQRQGIIPELPPGWSAESELRSAGGTPFAGDFIVAARRGELLEVAVVDVSGKGTSAGTRALQLSGALGGLLAAMPAQDFLEAANDYLVGQEWGEGFATAVHLSLDLVTGDYEIRSAGHPPAALRTAGSGRWSVLEADGPVLGLIEGWEYQPTTGTMRPGDALLMYTDGMVETRDRDIMLGVDHMLGRAEHLLRGKFDGGAARLVESIGARDDDRALLLVHRR